MDPRATELSAVDGPGLGHDSETLRREDTFVHREYRPDGMSVFTSWYENLLHQQHPSMELVFLGV